MGIVSHVTVFLCCAFALITAIFLASWLNDRHHLKRLANSVAADAASDSERIIMLTEWVYSNQGFAKNKRYFLFRAFGPTPMHVLEHGGDCADKSRLLSAMLKQVGVPTTLAMLYPCRHCAPVHTVVEARSENGWMAVDPVYNLWFPLPSDAYYSDRYLGLKELKSRPELLNARLQYLRAYRGPSDKINFYDADTTIYNHAKTINWDKNALLQFLGAAIRRCGVDPDLMRRPYVLEDPKLALETISASITIALFFVYILLRNHLSATPPIVS